MEKVHAELGPATIPVNAAETDVPGPAEYLDMADWDGLMNVNLRAVAILRKQAQDQRRSPAEFP